MTSAHALRAQIEHALERRFPAALSPAPRPFRETAATGIPVIDELLEGGLPVGAISEVTGPECSGRTSVALAFLGRCTQVERVCAWVDANDAFDPESAAANGVRLQQLLWVRCREENVQRLGNRKPQAHPDRAHPGSARPDWARLGWTHLDKAIRATDLLLQAGGFSSIVLDLGSTDVVHARRIPLATWFRFRQAAQRTQCSLVVLAQKPCAQSSADTVLDCVPLRANATGQSVLGSITYEVRRERTAADKRALSIVRQRKQPVSSWSAPGAWDTVRQA